MDRVDEKPPAATQNVAALAALLFLVTFITFLPAIKNEFVTYDDPEYITSNDYVKSGLTWGGVKWAFAAHGANWHPVTWLSHLADGQLFGERPWGHHLTNVFLHAVNALLAFLLFLRLTKLKWPSFFVALLFALHPLRVESVAWAAERKDVLSGLFFFLTLLVWARYVTAAGMPGKRHRLYYALSLVFFALGLMSKSMLVTTPCVLLLLDYWPLARFNGTNAIRLLIEKIPHFLLAVVFSAVAFIAQAHGSAMNTSVPFSVRAGGAVIAWCRYLGKIFWPTDLSPLYPYSTIPPAAAFAAAGFLVGITLLALTLRRRVPALIVGWLWFVGMLVPVIGIIKIGEQSIADRYTYLPCLGVMIMVVWAARAFAGASRKASLGLSAIGAFAAIICAAVTQHQIKFWANTEAMFQRAVDTTQNNTLADVGLAICLADRGQLDEAVRLYRESIKVSPHYFESHYNLGLALLRQNKLDDAVTEFKAALDTWPADPHAHISLGVAYAQLGRRDDAIAQFHAAARFSPLDPLPHDNIAKALSTDDAKLDEAISEFETALKLDAHNASRQSDLSALLMRKNRFAEAAEHLRQAAQLDPNSADIRNNYGIALAQSGHLDEAIAQFQAAVKINPYHADAGRNLARALNMKQSPGKPAAQ